MLTGHDLVGLVASRRPGPLDPQLRVHRLLTKILASVLKLVCVVFGVGRCWRVYLIDHG